VQALSTLTVRRPWHWGIVVLSDPTLGGEIPDVDPGARVSAHGNGIVVLVRHAQDIPSFDGDFDWAEATATVRHWSEEPTAELGRTALFQGALATPSGRLWLGDADNGVVISGLTETSVLRVSSPSDELDSPDQIWIDVWKP
jgi:hypothetical protein